MTRRLYFVRLLALGLLCAALLVRPAPGAASPGTFVYTGYLYDYQYQVYTLTLYKGEQVTATETCGSSRGVDPQLYVLYPNLSLLAYNDDGMTSWPCAYNTAGTIPGGYSAIVTFTVPADGTYYFAPSTFDNQPPPSGEVAPYTLTITVIGVDADGDGYTRPTDCNDNNASIHPGAFDIPGDGIDQNCDGHDAHRPVANSDTYSTNKNTTLNIAAPGVLGNDTDVDGDTLTAVLSTTTSHGSLTLYANGSFSYTPSLNYVGADSFTYRANDGVLNSSGTATVTINVTNSNTAPVAAPDSYTTPEDTPLVITAPGILGNDTDAENDPLTVMFVHDPTHGTLVANADGSFTYTPDLNYNGTDSFSYRANDGFANSSRVTVTLTITPVNDPPVANNDTYSTAFGTTLNIPAAGVLSNDTDLDGDSLTAVSPSFPSHGSVTLNDDGSFSYTPTAGYSGPDSFTYYAFDGALNSLSPATVTINIAANVPPVAHDDIYSTAFETTLDVTPPGLLSNDTDAEGSPLTVLPGTDPANGTLTLNTDGSFSYTPNTSYSGSDTFTYYASDGTSSSTTAATVTINVGVNTPPFARSDAYATAYNTLLTIGAPGVLDNDTDLDGSLLTAVSPSAPANGTLNLNDDGSFTYMPGLNFSGTDSFTYYAFDGTSNSASPATVTISVGPNSPPVGSDDAYSMYSNTSLSVPAPGVLSNDSDANGDPLQSILPAGPFAGSLSLNADGSFTYIPNPGFTGTDSFTYYVNDGVVNSNTPATVRITITTPPNAAPVANNDTYTTSVDTPLSVPAPGVLSNDTDADSDPLNAILVTNTSHGSLTLYGDGSFSYTPVSGYIGTDNFTYRANDTKVNSAAPAIVTIVIAGPSNTPPVANGNTYNTPMDTPLTIAAPGVLGNDTDVDGNPLTAVLASGTTSGGLALNANGSFTYTPNTGYTGVDTFTYYAHDGLANSAAPATVTINVSSVPNSPPVANNDSYATIQDTPLTVPVPGVLSNDTDPDNDSITAVIASYPSSGAVTLNSSGSLTYLPNPGFTGTDSFTYYANDGTTNSAGLATVTITVTTAPNGAPVAVADNFSTPVNTVLNIAAPGLLGNDTDAENDPLTIIYATSPHYGTITIYANGAFDYTPVTGFVGTDSFTYQITDGTSNSGIATVWITVGNPNASVEVKVPAPPPATLCTDTNFEDPGMIRSHFTNDIDRAGLYCRLIASGYRYMTWYGSPLTTSANVGNQTVLDLGVIAAVDVYSMIGVTGFVGDVNICLKGYGYMIYMNANSAPREPQLWSTWLTGAFPGYTCTTLYAPGTVIMVAHRPK